MLGLTLQSKKRQNTAAQQTKVFTESHRFDHHPDSGIFSVLKCTRRQRQNTLKHETLKTKARIPLSLVPVVGFFVGLENSVRERQNTRPRNKP